MACWVVPSIAAEFWRVPLDHVLDQIRRNAVPVRHENGFTFVDVMPDPQPQQSLPSDQRPPTYIPSDLLHLQPQSAPAQPAVINPDWVSHNPTRLQTATSRRAPARAA